MEALWIVEVAVGETMGAAVVVSVMVATETVGQAVVSRIMGCLLHHHPLLLLLRHRLPRRRQNGNLALDGTRRD